MHTPCVKKIKEHLDHPYTYKNVTLIQPRLLEMTSYPLLISFTTPTKKIIWPNRYLNVLHISTTSPKSINPSSLPSNPLRQAFPYYTFLLPSQYPYTLPLSSQSPSDQCYQYVLAQLTNSQTMPPTSCNILLKYSNCTSATASISYNFLNPSHLILIIPTHTTFCLLFWDLCAPYPKITPALCINDHIWQFPLTVPTNF